MILYRQDVLRILIDVIHECLKFFLRLSRITEQFSKLFCGLKNSPGEIKYLAIIFNPLVLQKVLLSLIHLYGIISSRLSGIFLKSIAGGFYYLLLYVRHVYQLWGASAERAVTVGSVSQEQGCPLRG
jgi:hypothetical protein